MDWILLLALALAGLISGWVNVLAGGGSLLTLPIMLLMGIDAPSANGTNRIGILFQNLFAIYGFFRKGLFDFKLSLTLGLFAGAGSFLGANVGVTLKGALFNNLLAVVMGVIMLLMLFNKENPKAVAGGEPKRIVLGHVLMLAAGFWGGMIQVGTGFILMPILNRVMNCDLVHTNMYKVFIVLVYTIVALAVYATNVPILWIAGTALAIGTSIGGYFGAHTTVTKGEVWVKRVLFITLSFFIIKLLFFSNVA